VPWDNTNEGQKIGLRCIYLWFLIFKVGKGKSIKPEQAWSGLYCGAAVSDDVFNSNKNKQFTFIVWPSHFFTTQHS